MLYSVNFDNCEVTRSIRLLEGIKSMATSSFKPPFTRHRSTSPITHHSSYLTTRDNGLSPKSAQVLFGGTVACQTGPCKLSRGDINERIITHFSQIRRDALRASRPTRAATEMPTLDMSVVSRPNTSKPDDDDDDDDGDDSSDYKISRKQSSSQTSAITTIQKQLRTTVERIYDVQTRHPWATVQVSPLR